MSQNVASYAVFILAKTIADRLRIAEDFISGQCSALRYHACAFLRHSATYAI
ncbi:hypothetical protein P775_28700 [Puniceibacterium antarcticum]|uniref:Uncharacterized protein n=1 Tax=Puniceibacterium antarcticum TaxID=1206336 RepID=A0A2G8QR43_9RHOB|nr:hypothetical protein P775_28700 [Puniceibacterium antarcticum]